ncbi:hypothetical protein ACN47E_004531 [Coniothyrium glycines]
MPLLDICCCEADKQVAQFRRKQDGSWQIEPLIQRPKVILITKSSSISCRDLDGHCGSRQSVVYEGNPEGLQVVEHILNLLNALNADFMMKSDNFYNLLYSQSRYWKCKTSALFRRNLKWGLIMIR